MKTNPVIMRYTTFAFSSLGLAVAVQTASAQVGAPQQQQVDNAQFRRELSQSTQALSNGETVPELYTGETSDVGPQSVVKFKPRKSYLKLSADAQYFHTDNMFLADGGKVGTDVLASMVQAALAPGAYSLGEGQFSPRLGYRHEWFNYGLASSKTIGARDFNDDVFKDVKLREFDFNAQTVFTDARWRQGNWIVGAGFDYQRLLDSDRYEQFYDEYVPRWKCGGSSRCAMPAPSPSRMRETIASPIPIVRPWERKAISTTAPITASCSTTASPSAPKPSCSLTTAFNTRTSPPDSSAMTA